MFFIKSINKKLLKHKTHIFILTMTNHGKENYFTLILGYLV